MSDFAIAVLHERRGTYLEDCLKRLAGAMQSANETIVVTDPSDPCAADEIRAAQSKYSFRVVHAPDDFAARKNAAILETRGEYLAVVSALDMPEEGCVEALVEFMDSNPKAGAAGALLMRENGYPRPSALRAPSLKSSLAGVLRLVARLDVKGYYFGRRGRRIEKPVRARALPASCLVYRRKALEAVGGFEEGWRFRFDDIDWAVRAREFDWRFWIAPNALAYHVAPEQFGLIEKDARLVYERALMGFVGKHCGWIREKAFRVTRLAGVAGLTFSSLIALALTALNSRSGKKGMSTAWALFGLLVFDHECESDAPGAEYTTRWQSAPWVVS